MRYIIRNEGTRRIRIHIVKNRISAVRADAFVNYFSEQSVIKQVKIYERLGDAVLKYTCSKQKMLSILDQLTWDTILSGEKIPENSVRSINQHFREQIIERVLARMISILILPELVSMGITAIRSVRYFGKAVDTLIRKRKIDTTVLDAAALTLSCVCPNYGNAGGVVFLLDIGQILEGWLKKNKVESLSESMALNIDYVWLYQKDGEIRMSADKIQKGDLVVVNRGEMIPFDGVIVSGAGSVIQTSMTGNALPVPVTEGHNVFAGTALEEGEICLKVMEENKISRYDKLVQMVDHSQNLRPLFESRAIRRADGLAPYLLAGSGLTYFLTKNIDRAATFLLINYSYALKLALPIAVLNARKKAMKQDMLVKGGRFMEDMAEADYIVFDKTGTLTKAEPIMKHVISCGVYSEQQLLAIAACMEEHVSNTVAKAIVRAALEMGISHEEVHSEIENVYAHGVVTHINGNRILFGSYHFIFEDEKCPVPNGLLEELMGSEHAKEHHMYLAINHKLEGIFCVEDVLRDEVVEVIEDLRRSGFKKVILLSGDTELSAKEAAEEARIGTYFAEKLPEEKAEYIKELQRQGHKVVMVGDGLNDSLALTVADVGICTDSGSKVTKELSDVVIHSDDLFSIVRLRCISQRLMKKMRRGYDMITCANAMLIALGVSGIMSPSDLSLFSDLSMIGTSLDMMK